MAYLSLLDDRAKPKGSRDPLGFELVWTHYGRRVIGNLTTITRSLDNFAVALLGFHWANERHSGLPPSEKPSEVRKTFLCYEQLAGYLRYRAGHGEIMGITRVGTRMEDRSTEVTLGLGADEQILSDQTGYGLWGFYSNAMRDSGLVQGEERQPTSVALEIAQAIEQKLDKSALLGLIRQEKPISHEVLDQYAASYSNAIRDEVVRERLLEILMRGGYHNEIQQEVWHITCELADNDDLPNTIPEFVDRLEHEARSEQLKSRLADIKSTERLLVAINNIFHYCRRKDGASVEEVLEELRKQNYSYGHIRGTPDFSGIPRGTRLASIRAALRGDDIESAFKEILTLNREVMEQREGAPWVEIEQDGTLRVRVPAESVELRSQQAIETAWDYDYFMSSYLNIAREAL